MSVGKDYIRSRVWSELRRYAKPDSRFHFNFSEFIPDFEGSEACVEKIRGLEEYRRAGVVFITPDNCLVLLRMWAIKDLKKVVMPTYGIRRGFVLLSRELVPEGKEDFAATLDGAELFGRRITLRDVMGLGRVDLIVTGASVVDTRGVRYGKGHGYFDLEWAMLREIGVVDDDTPVITVVHDVQLVEESIEVSPYDTVTDIIVTPTRIIYTGRPVAKPRGIIWEKLPREMVEEIPPLRELRELKSSSS